MYQDDTFTGGDASTLFGLPFEVTVTQTPLLLVRLELVPGSVEFAPQLGDFFAIDLIPEETTFPKGPWEPYSYTSEPGSLSVVPEPSSTAMLLGLAIIGLIMYRWRRKEHRC